MSFHFSAEQAEPWASVPLAVQPSQGRSASGDPRRQSGAARGPPGAAWLRVARPPDQGGRHPPHFSSWEVETQTGAATGSRPLGRAGPGPPRREPAARPLVCTGLRPGGRRLRLAARSLNDAPPLPARAPAGSREGAGPPARQARRHGNAAFLAERAGAWGCAAASWAAPRHGQPVRGGGGRLPGPRVPQQKGTCAALRSPGRRSKLGAHGGRPGSLCTLGREPFPCEACPRMPDGAPLSGPGSGTTLPRSPRSPHVPQAARQDGPPSWSPPPAGAGLHDNPATTSIPPGRTAPKGSPQAAKVLGRRTLPFTVLTS